MGFLKKLLRESDSGTIQNVSEAKLDAVFEKYSYDKNYRSKLWIFDLDGNKQPIIMKNETDKEFRLVRNVSGRGYLELVNAKISIQAKNENIIVTVNYSMRYWNILLSIFGISVFILLLNLRSDDLFQVSLRVLILPVLFFVGAVISYRLELLKFKDFFVLFCNELNKHTDS